jgi:putative transposase
MRIIEPLKEGGIYHLYNRGINSEDLFKERKDYYFFLDKYVKYCSGVLETYSYALLKNHFHFLVGVKENAIEPRRDGKGTIRLNASRQLSHFFNSYAQTVNNAYDRHGKLFEEPFKRKLVDSENYFTSLVYYIHFNPQHHFFVKDFREWEFTSYQSILSESKGFLEKSRVIDWFGTVKHFVEAHSGKVPFSDVSNIILE